MSLNVLRPLKIKKPNKESPKIKEIPISAVASQTNSSGFSAIKHKNTKRIATVYSALSPGETDAGVVVGRIQNAMKNFKNLPKGIKIDYTGQIEEMKKQLADCQLRRKLQKHVPMPWDSRPSAFQESAA